jgi:4,5-dihydroxyphthalate decarboxylase
VTLRLSLAFWNYDRTMPIVDGRASIAGCAPHCTILRPQALFPRAFDGAEFDVSELSLSRYAQAVANGKSQYTAIPVFPSRSFRHGSVYVRTDRVRGPADLAGCRIGVNNYDDTAAVVVRGLLRDHYGLGASDVTWVVGDLDAPARNTISPPVLHASIPVATLPPGRTLDAALLDGDLDGLVGLVPPSGFRAGSPLVRRLFPDWPAAERAYFAQTRLFPIMHVLGIRTSLVAAHPWLPVALMDAFEAAKAIAIDDLSNMQAPKVTLPWVVADYEATLQDMDGDIWPYGLARNRAVLATTLRHLMEDGLLSRPVTVDDLFPLQIEEPS